MRNSLLSIKRFIKKTSENYWNKGANETVQNILVRLTLLEINKMMPIHEICLECPAAKTCNNSFSLNENLDSSQQFAQT